MSYRNGLMAGQIVHGQKDSYQVEKAISERHKSSIYAAVSCNQGLEVVLKQGNMFPKGLEREATIQILIQKAGGHKNILSSYEIMKDQKIVVSPLIKTGTLGDLLWRKIYLPEDETIEVALSLCEALDYLHSLGIVYRDLKAGNVLLDGATPTLYDFDVTWHDCISNYDIEGCAYGSPVTMAPEVFRGGKTDPRQDIYSLGVLLYEMLSGVSPFRAPTSNETIKNQLHKKIHPIMGIAPALNYVIMRAVEKNPDERYQTAAELKQDLELIKNGIQAPRIEKDIIDITAGDFKKAYLNAVGRK